MQSLSFTSGGLANGQAAEEFLVRTTVVSLAILLAAAAAGVVGQVIVKKSVARQPPSIEQALLEIAKEINKNTPTQIDANTRLMNAVALGTTLRYRYSLIGASHNDFVKGSIGRLHGDRLRANVCSTEGMRPLVELGAILEYAYYDKAGFELEVVPIETVLCQKK